MIDLPKIALGAWAWGNDGTFGNNFTAEALKPIFDAAMASGLNLWDTAYAYGMGTSEKVLAGFIRDLPRESYLISDKFTPQCANGKPTAMADMIGMQLQIMNLNRFDIYWIHNVWDAPHWTEELAKYYEGRDDVPLLGVSNHNLSEIKQANDILKAHGLKLSAVQNHYSLINRSSEESGILDYCRENGITFFAYMVLEQGALSGKYHARGLRPRRNVQPGAGQAGGAERRAEAAGGQVRRRHCSDPCSLGHRQGHAADHRRDEGQPRGGRGEGRERHPDRRGDEGPRSAG